MAELHYEKCGAAGDVVCVTLSGELSTPQCDYLFQCVEYQIEDGCKKLILDCHDLEYISSMGLGMLIRVHARMKKHGGDVKVARLHGVAATAVHMMKLDRVFELYSTVEEAVAAHDGQ